MNKKQAASFKIAYDGTWHHEGAPILREALAKLFSDRALKIDEAGRYWLQTPFEKYEVEVEDVPFIIIDFTEKGGNIDFTTNMGETAPLGPEHPIILRQDKPYIEVRNGLYARLSRPVYYNLIEKYGAAVSSRGMSHSLGTL